MISLCFFIFTLALYFFLILILPMIFLFFFFNDTATTEIYPLSLPDALPISISRPPDEHVSIAVESTEGAKIRHQQVTTIMPCEVNRAVCGCTRAIHGQARKLKARTEPTLESEAFTYAGHIVNFRGRSKGNAVIRRPADAERARHEVSREKLPGHIDFTARSHHHLGSLDEWRTTGLIDHQRSTPRCTSVYGPDKLDARSRSEEHTSELQSLAYLVCRLLLEKKNRKAHSSSADIPGTTGRMP